MERGKTMDYLNTNIAVNLKNIRNAKGYSLDLVAEQTGVSKSMLGQIERGEANPTIGTLGKIVSGLRVELEDLVGTPKENMFPVKREYLVPTKEEPGKYQVFTYFPYEKDRSFEVYVIEIEPGGSYYSGSHGEHTREYLVVSHGELTLEMAGKTQIIPAGDAIRFDSDQEHFYKNMGKEKNRLICVFSYGN